MQTKNHPIIAQAISRRNFIKLGGLGLTLGLGLLLPPIGRISKNLTRFLRIPLRTDASIDFLMDGETLSPEQQGRVVDAYIDVYDIPSYSGTKINTYWRDWVLPITDITVGSSADSFNMIWYKIGAEGYAHSGSIQPVFTILNPVIADIPMGGTLAEVTVPFTDARWAPGIDQPVAYRFYYATTYWVIDLVYDSSGNSWYSILDDKWEYMFYAPANHFRLVPRDELAPISTDVPSILKRIEVHVPEQVMIAYEFNEPVFMARVASGAIFSNGDYSTPIGRHMTFSKRSSRHMARGNLAANGYDLPGVPWNSYITEDGIAFHGTYWHNNFGHPRSHGCINLTPQAAKWVYLWTIPTVPPDQRSTYELVGTAVDIIG
jgi:lipoprotein-anchoring transpeptidase ErfK/SrfK